MKKIIENKPPKNNRYLVYQIYNISYIKDITLAKKQISVKHVLVLKNLIHFHLGK